MNFKEFKKIINTLPEELDDYEVAYSEFEEDEDEGMIRYDDVLAGIVTDDDNKITSFMGENCYNFAKGKGTLSINFNYIFKTQRFAFEAYRTINQVGEFRQDSQNVYLGLSYRFGGGKNKALKRKKRDNFQKRDSFL